MICRFILGIGGGWKEDEYRAYGLFLPARVLRMPGYRRAVQIHPCPVDRVTGHVHRRALCVAEAYCEPRPDPAPVLMNRRSGEQRTLRVVARHADWWNADYYSPAEYGRKLSILHDHCRAIGRDRRRSCPPTSPRSASHGTPMRSCATCHSATGENSSAQRHPG